MNATTPRILIANRSKLACFALETMIKSFGEYNVAGTTTSGKEILSKIDDTVNLLIMDISLEGMSGYYLLKELAQKHKKLKVLILSESIHPYIINHAIKFGAGGYLPLESEPKAVKKAIQDILAKGIHYNKLMTKELVAGIRSKETSVIKITPKQYAFLNLCCTGLSYPEIAEKLHVSHRTIDWHRDMMFAKFSLNNRADLVMFALRTGLAHI